MANSKEAVARLKINKLLEEAGWRFFDNDEGELLRTYMTKKQKR